MKLFYGFFAPVEIIQSVMKLQSAFEKFSGKPIELESMHVALIFLGNVDKKNLNKLTKIGNQVAVKTKPFAVNFVKTELSPNKSKEKIIGISIKNSQELTGLQTKISEKLAKSKIQFEKNLSPQLTIMHIKNLTMIPLPKITNVNSDVAEFSLIESHLSSAGQTYKVVKNFTLGKADGQYRASVGICLFNDMNEILLIKNSIFPGEHWQIPQGGMEIGEDAKATAIRELAEETNITSGKFIKVSNTRYSHLYKNNPPENIYIGQEFTTVFMHAKGQPEVILDKAEAVAYKWAKMEDVTKTVAKSRREYMDLVLEELKVISKTHD